MTAVEFGQYPFRIREQGGSKQVYDPLRKAFVALNPEEWVRQHIVQYLLVAGYPAAMMAVERGISVNGVDRRFDVLVFDRAGHPLILVECKAPEEPLNQITLMQAAGYNVALHAPYCWITNGTQHYFIETATHRVLPTIPLAVELYQVK